MSNKNREEKYITAYTDIDSLFDTRWVMLGALTESGKYDLNHNDYFIRVRDNFGTLSSTIFNYYYDRRSKTVLNNASPTYVNSVITEYFMDRVSVSKDTIDTRLYVNRYPYNLTEEECKVIDAVIYKMFPSTKVIFLNIPLKEIDFKWVKKNVDMMIFYNAVEWVEMNIAKIGVDSEPINSLIKNVSIFAPLKLKGMLKKNDVKLETIISIKNYLGQFCLFEYLPLSYFSLRKE